MMLYVPFTEMHFRQEEGRNDTTISMDRYNWSFTPPQSIPGRRECPTGSRDEPANSRILYYIDAQGTEETFYSTSSIRGRSTISDITARTRMGYGL
jgi:hypothetical protein